MGFIIVFFILLPIALIFYRGYAYAMKSKFNFKNELLLLTAHIIKVDKNPSVIELKYVKAYFLREFGKRKTRRYIAIINTYLKIQKDFKITNALKTINFEQDNYTKIQLLHFLLKITIIDKYLTNTEYYALRVVCIGIGLNEGQLKSLLAMYSFLTEAEQENRKQQKNHKSKVSKYRINNALTVLELVEECTDDEIKKAYRKLVILYHPDKIMHLDNHLQKGAKEMFQKVNDAYDYLKEKKGFK